MLKAKLTGSSVSLTLQPHGGKSIPKKGTIQDFHMHDNLTESLSKILVSFGGLNSPPLPIIKLQLHENEEAFNSCACQPFQLGNSSI